jgi:hypothetical protein
LTELGLLLEAPPPKSFCWFEDGTDDPEARLTEPDLGCCECVCECVIEVAATAAVAASLDRVRRAAADITAVLGGGAEAGLALPPEAKTAAVRCP